MGYQVSCECGECLPVQEADAGSSVNCRCGRRVVVPLLEELDTGRVIVSAASIERRIRRMIASGDLPAGRSCERCETPDVGQRVNATIQCERYRSRTSGGLRFFYFPGLFWVYWNEEKRTEILGRDTDVPAPFCLCDECRNRLPRPRAAPYLLLTVGLTTAAALLISQTSWVGVLLLPLALGIPWWLLRRALKRRQRAIKQALRRVPVYRQLLDRSPQAVVVLPEN
jgi:hypothetical protein